MKKTLLVISVVALALGLLVPAAAHAATIDGPANVRDNPKGKTILSLNDGVEVDSLRDENKWHLIFVQAVLSEGDIMDEGSIRKDAVLFNDKGEEIGKTLEEISTFVRADMGESKPKVDIWAYTYEGNVVKGKPDIADFERYFRSMVREFGWGIDKNSKYIHALADYEIGICGVTTGPQRLWEVNKEPKYVRLVMKIMKEGETTNVRSCAAEAFRNGLPPLFADPFLESMKDEIVQALKEALKDESDAVRVNAAGSLLTYGEGDAALPVLDEIVMGNTENSRSALYSLFGWKKKYENGEEYIIRCLTCLLDDRGKKIIEKALSSPNKDLSQYAERCLKRLDEKKNHMDDPRE